MSERIDTRSKLLQVLDLPIGIIMGGVGVGFLAKSVPILADSGYNISDFSISEARASLAAGLGVFSLIYAGKKLHTLLKNYDNLKHQ